MHWMFPDSWYVQPVKLTQKYDRAGQPIRGEYDRAKLPDALFAPGVSTEDQMLSDVAQHRGQLFFQASVGIQSNDTIEIPDRGAWSVIGYPNEWPLGTAVTLQRKR